MRPYEALTPLVASVGAEAATLVADDPFLAGNLRRLFPAARIVHRPDFTPPIRRSEHGTACWRLRDGDETPDRLEEAIETLASWPHLWRADGWRVSRYAIAPLAISDPLCKL